MFLVHVDQFHLVLGHFFFVGGFKYENDVVRTVPGSKGHRILAPSTPQDFGHTVIEKEFGTFAKSEVFFDLRSDVHSHREISVASEFVKAITPEVEGDQGDVGIVHGLDLDT